MESPADKALAEQGGEIIPEEFGGKALPVATAPTAQPREIDVPNAREVKGAAAPELPPESPEQLRWKENLARLINLELNVYNSCFESTRRMVNILLASMPADSADIGEGQWGPGKRTPLELAEPEIALEVYRQVRGNMHEQERREREDELEGLRALLRKALGKP